MVQSATATRLRGGPYGRAATGEKIFSPLNAFHRRQNARRRYLYQCVSIDACSLRMHWSKLKLDSCPLAANRVMESDKASSQTQWQHDASPQYIRHGLEKRSPHPVFVSASSGSEPHKESRDKPMAPDPAPPRHKTVSALGFPLPPGFPIAGFYYPQFT